MTLTKREVFLLIFLMALVAGIAYRFFFWSHISYRINNLNDSIVQINIDISAAESHSVIHAGMIDSLEALEVLWEEYYDTLPIFFDQADVLNRMQVLMYPVADELSIGFVSSTELQGGLWLNTVSLDFNVGTSGNIMHVLYALAQENIDNRVISYSLVATEFGQGAEWLQSSWDVVLNVDFLSMSAGVAVEGNYSDTDFFDEYLPDEAD